MGAYQEWLYERRADGLIYQQTTLTNLKATLDLANGVLKLVLGSHPPAGRRPVEQRRTSGGRAPNWAESAGRPATRKPFRFWHIATPWSADAAWSCRRVRRNP
jgi:hypothetical protein